jgi:acyl-CoA thioester hydrolase
MPADFIWNVRVYYEDTDAGGIVYYANYLKFFERATRVAAPCTPTPLAEHDMFVVKSVSADYHAPAKLDDELKLTVSIEKIGRASIVFPATGLRGETLLNTARVKVGCVDSACARAPCLPSLPTNASHHQRLINNERHPRPFFPVPHHQCAPDRAIDHGAAVRHLADQLDLHFQQDVRHQIGAPPDGGI